MNKTKYSIVYAMIRPEINERLSVAIIVFNGQQVFYQYSERKLRAVKELFSDKEYDCFEGIVKGLGTNKAIPSEQDVSYLSRYSNNLITFSELKDIDLPYNKESSDWMFFQFVDASYALQK